MAKPLEFRTRTDSFSFHDPRNLAPNGQLPILPGHWRNHCFPRNDFASGLNGPPSLFRPPSHNV